MSRKAGETRTVQNYDTLTKKIESNERYSLSYWNSLVKKALDETEEEIVQRTGLPQSEKLVTFSEYRSWAESLGKLMGWSKETE